MRVRLLLLALLVVSSLMILPMKAHASDGQWVKYSGNPVLTPTPDGWDSDLTISPKVIFDGAIFRMWYVGGHAGATGIGYANSTDGIVWNKYSSPVLSPGPPGSWDSSQVGLGSILWNGTVFLMWYRGSSPVTYAKGAVGLATSSDGLSWIKYQGNPVLKPTEIDQKYLASPTVIRLNNTYNMWYTGKSATDSDSSQITRILYATSFDGVKWFKWPLPVLSPSTESNAWDASSVFSPAIIYDGSIFGLWYSGISESLVNPQIGFATSPDGATWTRSQNNPILSLGASNSWDSAGIEQPCTVVGNGFMLYYDGFSENSGGRIGLAQSPQGFTIPEFPAPISGLILGALAGSAICYIRRKQLQSEIA